MPLVDFRSLSIWLIGSVSYNVFKILSPFLLILLFLYLLPSLSLLFSDLPGLLKFAHFITMQFHLKAKGRVLVVTCYPITHPLHLDI